MKKLWASLLFWFCAILAGAAWGSDLKDDERVWVLASLAVEQADGSFRVRVDVWVFEKESRNLAVSALAAGMGIDLDQLSPEQKATFAERTYYFRTDSERGKQLKIRLADQILTLPRTDAAGRATGEFNVGRERVQWFSHPEGFKLIPWTLEAPGHSLHGALGAIFVIPAEGVSIVSDIDDTIKISEVLDRKALIRNTFLEPFRVVPGMAEWYREMADDEPQAFFHYLSASPIQLHLALTEFLQSALFPQGLLHLRESTSWRTLYANQDETIAHKKNVLTRLLTDFPKRKFILIGDSGESDPEIYADIARSYPGRIIAIHIRNVTNEDRAAVRYQQTFNGIAPQIWHIRD